MNQKNEKVIELYHVSSEFEDMPDLETLTSFLDNGAVSNVDEIANGGQKGGFYVWSTKQMAEKHALYLDGHTHLRFGFQVPVANIQYPDWMVDLEACSVGNLFKRHQEEIKKVRQFDCQAYDIWGENPRPECFKVLDVLDNGDVKIFSPINGEQVFKQKDIRNLGQIEAILTTLIETSKDFREDYNRVVQTALAAGKNLALKYRGKDPLPIHTCVALENDYRNKKVKETVLLDPSEEKSRRACPFVEASKFLTSRKTK